MAKQDSESDPLQGQSDAQPTSEFVTLSGLAAAATASVALGSKAMEWLVPKDPFLVLVTDSYKEKEDYVVKLELRNLDVHTVYVEEINVAQPLQLIKVRTIEHSGTYTEGVAPPYRISSHQSEQVFILMKLPPPEMTYGEIDMEISRLAQSASETRTARFLIRSASGTSQVW